MQAFVRGTWGETRGEMVELMLSIGAWPERDDEYKDVKTNGEPQQWEIPL